MERKIGKRVQTDLGGGDRELEAGEMEDHRSRRRIRDDQGTAIEGSLEFQLIFIMNRKHI